MSKLLKILLIFLVIDALLIFSYFIFRAKGKAEKHSLSQEAEWIKIDENYYPQDFIEAFIKEDASQKGFLPVFIRNYGRNEKILRRFVGKNFASPKEAELRLKFRHLEDWKLIELKYTAESGREIIRTILYVLELGEWKVGDNGYLTR